MKECRRDSADGSTLFALSCISHLGGFPIARIAVIMPISIGVASLVIGGS
jgi:hypothetical protein